MIISSMNLYEFSQQNNREMGILIERHIEADRPVYDDAWKDIESILNNATDFSYVEAPKETGKIKIEVTHSTPPKQQIVLPPLDTFKGKFLSATALSKELGISSKDLMHKIEKLKWIEKRDNEFILTSLGKSKGAEMKKGQYGNHIAYPEIVIKELI